MATQNNLHVPEDLLSELRAKAKAEGKTVDELAEEAIRQALKERSWKDLLAYGRERGRAAGIRTDQQVVDAVYEWRREQNRER
jgi:hypothetical protein